MKKIRAMKSVYSYYFPEIRETIDGLVKTNFHETFLQSINPGLDDFHLKIIDQYQEFIKPYLPSLADFKFRYFTNGSSEGIFHLLVYLKINYPDLPIYVFKGEYEGYGQYAKQLNKEIVEVDFDIDPKTLNKGFWFISNPSARNGEIIPNKRINKICDAGHKVILDGAYVGLTKIYEFDLKNKNIFAYISSLSKPLGLFYYRIGFVFCREEIKTLYPNIWFKNIFSLLIASEIFKKFNCDYFYNKYRPLQLKIIKEIGEETGLPIKASEALLLGFMDKNETGKGFLHLLRFGRNDGVNELNELDKYKRGEYYRFCLTPYFLEKEINI